MSIRGHGNWCGPGWTAGQWKDASELTKEDYDVPAIDALDQVCKDHDIDIASAIDDQAIEEANQKFIQNAKKLGLKGAIFAELVSWLGPTHAEGMSFANLPCQHYVQHTNLQEILYDKKSKSSVCSKDMK